MEERILHISSRHLAISQLSLCSQAARLRPGGRRASSTPRMRPREHSTRSQRPRQRAAPRLLKLLFLSWISPVSGVKAAGLTGKGPLHVKQHNLKTSELELFWQSAPTLRSAEVARELRARRADYRAVHLDRPQGQVLGNGQSFCEREAVSKPVLKDYTRRVAEFRNYVATELKQVLEPGEDFVKMLLEYMDELFFQGYPSPDGQKLISALKHFYPIYQRGGSMSLSRAERALKGWSRHSLATCSTRAGPGLHWHWSSASSPTCGRGSC